MRGALPRRCRPMPPVDAPPRPADGKPRVPVVLCPHCGEAIDTWPDPGGGEQQQYVEDCSVCCRPILFRAVWSELLGEYGVEASAET
jgi:hypothetical protein